MQRSFDEDDPMPYPAHQFCVAIPASITACSTNSFACHVAAASVVRAQSSALQLQGPGVLAGCCWPLLAAAGCWPENCAGPALTPQPGARLGFCQRATRSEALQG